MVYKQQLTFLEHKIREYPKLIREQETNGNSDQVYNLRKEMKYNMNALKEIKEKLRQNQLK